MKKFNLNELKVNSFVTSLDGNLADTAKGGGTQKICSAGCTYHFGCQPQTNEFKCSLVVCPTDKHCPQPNTGILCHTEAPNC